MEAGEAPGQEAQAQVQGDAFLGFLIAAGRQGAHHQDLAGIAQAVAMTSPSWSMAMSLHRAGDLGHHGEAHTVVELAKLGDLVVIIC